MSILKSLIKLNNRLESSWSNVDFTLPSVNLQAGWYIGEFCVAGDLNHVPRILIQQAAGREQERLLTGAHSGRNRMLFYLPEGALTAHSDSIEFERLARLSSYEARFRTLLICARYLRDFFGFRALFRTVALQFRAPFERSTSLLRFYTHDVRESGYLENIDAWDRFSGYGRRFMSLFAGKAKIAVLIESESQREALKDMLLPPDWVILVSQAQAASGAIPDDADYVIPLRLTENLRSPALLMLKRSIRNAKVTPTLVYSDHDYQVAGSSGDADPEVLVSEMLPAFKPNPSRCYLSCFNYIGPAVAFSRGLVVSHSVHELMSEECCYQIALQAFADVSRVLHVSEALFYSTRTEPPITPPPHVQNSPWKNILWNRREAYNVLVADSELMEEPAVDLLIPTRDGLQVLKPCIDSILTKTAYSNFRIILVDNGSEKDETLAYFHEIEKDDRVEIVSYPGEFNYSAINNFAASKGNAPYIALVNNDIEVISQDWLTQLMAWAQQPEVGIVGAKLLFGDGRVQHAGVTIGMGNAAGHIHRLEQGDAPGYQMRCLATQNMMAVTAACMVTPRSLFEEMGGLNEDDFKVAYNDIDYCLRVEKSGKQIIWTPEAQLYHHESVSRGDDMSDTHIERYFKELQALQSRWGTKGFVDKYYSRHLRISDEGVYPKAIRRTNDTLRYLDAKHSA